MGMILIEECLRNFNTLQDLRMREISASSIQDMRELADVQSSFELSDLFVDITGAIERTEFTVNEVAVLRYILEGYNYSEIARETMMSRLAIPNHFARICNKLASTLGDEYYTKLREK